MLSKLTSLFSNKSKQAPPTIKSKSINHNVSRNYYGFFVADQECGEITPTGAYSLFTRVSSLGNVCRQIADTAASLPLVVRDEEGNKTTDNSFIDFLRNPSRFITKNQFFTEIMLSYLLTDEAWVIVRGGLSGVPTSLDYVRPYDVSIQFSPKDGYPTVIQTTSTRDKNIYTRDESGDNVRYIDKSGLNEIFAIIGTTSYHDGWRGLSRLNHIKHEANQTFEGAKHNLNLLKNSANLRGLFSLEKGVSQEQYALLAEEFEDIIASSRAGSMAILPAGVDKVQFHDTNNDMDFVNLIMLDDRKIYSIYSYPLALVNDGAQTFNNVENSQLQLYDRAINPNFNKIARGLTEYLGFRFKDMDGMELSYNELDIPALRTRAIENASALASAQLATTNEARASIGLSEIDGSGDVILINANKVPLNSVTSSFGGIE